MKNIHLIPTDKPSRLYKDQDNILNFHGIGQNQNIYITNSEEIKEGDWILNEKFKDVYKITSKIECNVFNTDKYFHVKKIIITTDQDLIADGVQAINDDFLEWFVKNPICEEIEIYRSGNHYDGAMEFYHPLFYDTIIPQEEPIRKIDTCYNFDMEIGCVQDICRCEKEEPKQETTLEEHYLSIPKPLVDVSRMKVDNNPDLVKQESLVEKMKPLQEQWQKDMEKSLNSKQEIIKESHKWLNDKFNGKGIEIRIIDWSKNEVNNYSPAKLIEEYAKWMQERRYSEEDIKKAIEYGAELGLNDDIGNSFEWSAKLSNWVKKLN